MRTAFVVALLIAAPVTPAFAQFDSGQISGFVRDAQQGALPGATVSVVSEATGIKRSTVTNSNGFYVLPDMPVGSYAVTVRVEVDSLVDAARAGDPHGVLPAIDDPYFGRFFDYHREDAWLAK